MTVKSKLPPTKQNKAKKPKLEHPLHFLRVVENIQKGELFLLYVVTSRSTENNTLPASKRQDQAYMITHRDITFCIIAQYRYNNIIRKVL